MIDDEIEEFLSHYGVKGMKWGVRRAEKKAAKADKKWQKNIYSVRGAIAVHNQAAERMNNGIQARINSDPRFRNAHLDYPDRPETQAYLRASERAFMEETARAVRDVHGTSPSGRLQARFDMNHPDGPRVVVEPTSAQHAAQFSLPTMTYELNVDSNGKVSSVRMIQDEIEQTSFTEVEDFLEHFGVKGMKWGVRRQGRLARAQRVGRGEGSVLDKLRVGVMASPVDIALGRGFQGAAQRRGARTQARHERFQRGEATVGDILITVGSTRYADLIPLGR